MGVEANLRISEGKGPVLPFSGFPRCSLHPLEKGENRGRKKLININNFAGLSRKWVGGQIVYVFPLFLGKKGNT